MTSKSVIRRKYQRISHSLDEKNRRLWCATEALAIKKGGIAMVHAATGVSRPTISPYAVTGPCKQAAL